MTLKKPMTWQSIQAEVLRRISEREWRAGDLIPGEVELADEFGCARATVNRALRQLAEAGLLDRRRKGGTRVTLHPVRKATLDIPITRLEVEQRGAQHSYKLLSSEIAVPPQDLQIEMDLQPDREILHLIALHLADNQPFMYEDRWVNSDTIPEVLDIDFTVENANEWLVQNALLTNGNISFFAANANWEVAEALNIEPGSAIFTILRKTWRAKKSITWVRLCYAPGFQMDTQI